MRDEPVLYLDLDDTVLTWEGGWVRAAPGAREFVLWALERFEVRWLTRWCPDGEMPERLLHDLGKMLGLSASLLEPVRGFDWSASGSKLDGVAWLEHVVLGRPFVWLEDQHGCGTAERAFLEAHDLLAAHLHCNVTEDEDALRRAHGALVERFGASRDVAPWRARRIFASRRG